MEFSKLGRVEEIHVVDNVGDHMIGNIYVKFADEEQAADALQVMHGRYYDGIVMNIEYSPVTDFRESRCRDFDEESCKRGGYCNFLHVKPVPMPLIRSLEEDCEEDRRRHAEEKRRRDSDDEERHRKKKRRREHKKRSSSKHRDRHRRRDDDESSSSGSD